MDSMTICFSVSLAFLIIWFGINISSGLIHAEITKKQLKINMFVFVLLLSMCAFGYKYFPNSSIDIVRHYEEIDLMRANGFDYVKNFAKYKDLFVINYFMYLVSLTNYNSLFIAIPLFIDLTIASYILIDQYEEDKIDMNNFLISLVVFLAMFSIKYLISAVRTNFAISVGVLGIYLEYIKKENRTLGILCYIASIFIHYFAAIILIIRLLLILIKNNNRIALVLLLIYPVAILFSELVYPTGSNYLNRIFSQIIRRQYDFSSINTIRSMDLYQITMLLIFVFFAIIMFVLSYKKSECPNCIDKRKNNYSYVVSIIALGLIPNFLFLERFIMLLSSCSIMILPQKIKKSNNSFIIGLLFLVAIYSLAWDLFFIGINYTGFNPLAGFKS